MAEATAQAATRTRCRHCYADIDQPVRNGWWRRVEDESLTCDEAIGNLRHEPLPKA